MVEFALSASVLIPLFLGTFQFGYTFYVYDLLSTQIRSGARYGSLKAFTCVNATSITGYKTDVKNMVNYGNPNGTGNLFIPGYTPAYMAAHITVDVLDAAGNPADASHVPVTVIVSTTNFDIDAAVRIMNFNQKPRVEFPYAGRYAPLE